MPKSDLEEQEFALARHIRDPEHFPPPPGIEDRRLAVYRELFYNSIEGLLEGNFPVIRKILDDQTWHDLIRAFYRDYRCTTPLFPEVAREFIRYLELRQAETGDLPPWMPELAHYEWVELALDLAEESVDFGPDQPPENLMPCQLQISPLAWALAYEWPVHRLGPDFIPESPPEQPTFLIVQRDAQYQVNFKEIDALTYLLLESIEQNSDMSFEQHLRSLAEHVGTEANAEFMRRAHALAQVLIKANILAVSPNPN